jgi:ATP-binding cassette, subfamily B, bacterial CvaB/MchF/RaxB
LEFTLSDQWFAVFASRKLGLNRYSDFVNANVRLGRAKITFKTISDGLFALENIVSIYLAARLALHGSLTIGMVFAFMSYKRNFTEKANLLVEKAIEYRIIGLHLERLSDIALTDRERGHDRPLSYPGRLKGRIEVRNVCFRYADTEPFILENM